ncbi:transporter substrate-binding domain-containing protein [Opitutus sp. ER46]|uniref:transporter substrate-binding domain-containing protein n=1 Tax=Opitutus sp. ER46 TaxID=2161864 RepID=UPI000D30EB77|nr:transporter substrate-binding domain-containing protein [Opitutus sp. ER46]PTX98586.1 hypothetical protein DB354_04800 [Opitutus sp. ER46]
MRASVYPRWTTSLFCLIGTLVVPLRAADEVTTPDARVGVLVDNYPFSYRTAQGNIAGFAYDLAREIERVMALRFERVEGPTQEINAAFREGRLDLLQSYADSPERAKEVGFSVPYTTMAGAIFVRVGDRRVSSFTDLRRLRVAVHQGSLGETVLRRAGFEAAIVPARSVEDTLQKVARGEADATLVGRLSGLALAHHIGLKNIRALPAKVPHYEVRYCFAVHRSNSELLARINEGLAILVRTGRFDEIHEQWFGHIEPVGYSALQVSLAVAVGLGLALIVSLWAVVRLRRLQRRILRQQEALRASEEWHRTLFEGAHDGLVVLERDAAGELNVRQINPAALALLGAAPLPTGTPLRQVLDSEAPLLEQLTPAIARGGTAEFEYQRAGKAAWWRVKVGPLGQHTLLSLADATDAVRTREQLREQEQRLMQSQKLEAIGTLAGGVAHDFNNILTAIFGNTEVSLLTLPPDRPEVELLQRVMQAAGRARQLVRQILTFSRHQATVKQPLHTGPVIQETLDLLRSAARSTVTLEFRATPGLPPVMADPGQLHQVLMNIGMNAVQALRGSTGRLTLTEDLVEFPAPDRMPPPGLPPGRYVRIGLQDTGPGIPPNVLPRIFEPFFSTKPAGEGTGLGLSVVHGIMHQHGGAVTVASELGHGTRFDLYFPVSDAPPALFREPEPKPASGRGEMILLVDDDDDCLRGVRQALTQLGYRVTAFSRAEEALAAYRARPDGFRLIITDLAMPGMNGLQFVSAVRTLDPEKPIVLASGFFSEAEEAEAHRLHVSRCIHKPLTVSLLETQLHSLLRAKS